MANWWDAIPVDLTLDEIRRAREAAEAWMEGKVPDRHNRYWTQFQMNLFGILGETGVAKFLGLPYRPTTYSSGQTGAENVGGYEVKCIPWRCIEHWHLTQGGRIFIADHARYDIIAVSYFLNVPQRIWVDGWMPLALAKSYPRGGQIGRDGIRRHAVPYAHLLALGSTR